MTGAIGGRFAGGSSSALRVTVNNVTRVRIGAGSSGLVTSVQLPNTVISGGVGPYTVLWENVGGSPDPVPNTETSLNPTWSAEVFADDPAISTFRITVTDATGATATAENQISLTWIQS